MYTICFTKSGITYEKSTEKNYICFIASTNTKHIYKIDIEYKYKDEHVTVSLDKHLISSFYYSIINYENCNNGNMWEKIKRINKEYFIYGFISYIGLVFLFEQTDFMTLLPIKINVPCTIARGDCCDAQMMKYFDKALKGILNTLDNQFVYHYLHFVHQFIIKHGKMFHIGPIIDNYYHQSLHDELSKLTQKTSDCTDNNTCNSTNNSTCDSTTEYTTTNTSYDCTYENTTECTIENTSYENTSDDVTSDNIVSYYTCSTCNDDTCTCNDNSCTYETSNTSVEECNFIQLTFEQTCTSTLTEADKMVIRQMIREEIQKYIK